MRKKLLRSRSGFEKPESREEAIMQNILGASNVLEPSESNIEEILKSILYNTPYTKEAEFEIEKILLAIKNNGTYDGEGESRDIKILIAILNDLDYTEEAESRIEELFIEWLHQRSSIKVIEGVPPLSFTAKGKPLTAWSITGNTVQNGTPTPENPVEVQAVGDRTGNLFDGLLIGGHFTSANFDILGDEDVYKSIKVFLPAGTYTFSWGKKVNVVRLIIDGNYSQPVYTDVSSYTIISTTDGYVGISFRDTTSSSTVWDVTTPIMLNAGTEPLPYEPYGYKIPFTTAAEDGSESVTTTVYLDKPLYSGEVMRSDGTITRSDGTTETFTAPQIPTLNGTTIIDVDTAVKPSNVYIEYK